MTETLPYGSWPSIITAADLAASALRPAGATFVGNEVWWAEGVAAEQGRVAIFREGSDAALLPAPWSAVSRVHEYGGGAWGATAAGAVAFVNGPDQRIWLLAPGESEPVALTPDDPSTRYGGLSFADDRLIAIRERHTGAAVHPRDIVEVPLDGSGNVRSLVAGSHFFAHPRLSPDGSRLAWLAWNHPDMPWDAAEARVGTITDGGVVEWTTVSKAAATQVEWTPTGEVIFTDDPDGRWNLYRWDGTEVTAIAPVDADTGGPLWSLGSSWFAVLDDGRIVAVRTNGNDHLVVIDLDGVVRQLEAPITGGMDISAAGGSRVIVTGASPLRPLGIWDIDVDAPASARCVRGGEAPWEAAWLPVASEHTFAGEHGEVHAFSYAPTNPNVIGPDGDLPPYVLLAHGGPTGHVSAEISPSVAYFTSRGIGVLDVNYGGSTGYGRAYRERLRGSWGVVDVDDMITAAHGLVARGLADGKRLAVKGGSAGGLTVLGSLVRGGTFAAGLSRYGVADLRSLLEETHDFESHYTESLVGSWPADAEIYRQNSPLTHAADISVPVLILQGDLDEVVPPSQSEAIRDALAERGVPHRYIVFEGERHGFRNRESIIAAAQSELSFLGAVFGFIPADVSPMRLD